MSTLKIKRENGKIFCPLADSWHIETPEEKVRQEYIKILVENYGYSLDQMAQEIKVNNSQRGQGKARADIVIWKSKQDKIESKAAFIVVECKAENVRIREEDYIIYGKLRPYLNKYWENRSATKNVVCSSEFFVFDTKNINRIYFMEILSSTVLHRGKELTDIYIHLQNIRYICH